jgi:hypothetical protein
MTQQLIEAYEEYIQLLAEAEAALMSFAYVHGWRCPEDLVERGKECRAKIAELKIADAELAGENDDG